MKHVRGPIHGWFMDSFWLQSYLLSMVSRHLVRCACRSQIFKAPRLRRIRLGGVYQEKKCFNQQQLPLREVCSYKLHR